MNAHQRAIWDRGNAEEIMNDSRLNFEALIKEGKDTEAHVMIASDHYSLVKRYIHPAPVWIRIFALWHMWQAVEHAKKAHAFGLRTPEQVDVVSRILKTAPKWLGGNTRLSEQMIQEILRHGSEMKNHTRALLYTTLGEIKFGGGMPYTQAKTYFDNALLYARGISGSESEQLCRALFGPGRFFAEFGDTPDAQSFGIETLDSALVWATRGAPDQVDKIRNEILRIRKKIQDEANLKKL